MGSAKRRRVTLREVAKLAGVSVASVSNVVNRREGMVSEPTRIRIEDAMRTLNYSPDARARGLRLGVGRTIAFLVLDEHAGYLADPLTASLLAGVGDVARDLAYSVLIEAERPSKRGSRILKSLDEGRADGACLVLSGRLEQRERLRRELDRMHVPYGIFDEPASSELGVSVRANNEDGARQLAEHLIGQGHTRIGFVAAKVPWPVVEQRFAGFRGALADAGLDLDPHNVVFEGDASAESGRAMARELLDQAHPPTAIMATSDLLAMGVLSAARERAVVVPEQLAVTGFNDFAFAAFTDPPLTTVRVPGYEMGRRAAESVIARIDGREAPAVGYDLPVEVEYRASSRRDTDRDHVQ